VIVTVESNVVSVYAPVTVRTMFFCWIARSRLPAVSFDSSHLVESVQIFDRLENDRTFRYTYDIQKIDGVRVILRRVCHLVDRLYCKSVPSSKSNKQRIRFDKACVLVAIQ
jgi:predicted transcriptional regulator